MNKISIKAEVRITATVELTEGHLRALDALAGYGPDAFLRAFYVKLGTAYMKPFEKDLRELFTMIRNDVPLALDDVKKAREQLKGGVV
ncbi:hypothetical protein [Undibacterium sp. CY21W]|uniref:hypothetical protein n=1 Tax=Undibacterium sp. CY21W TaxID=2762293 RepID=UPI00164AEF0B|nr:hypothetical protein [Undibacterium sp. CY21W]MBC3927809.1 hypothetical protein [Undibacterium sp. CY21W]